MMSSNTGISLKFAKKTFHPVVLGSAIAVFLAVLLSAIGLVGEFVFKISLVSILLVLVVYIFAFFRSLHTDPASISIRTGLFHSRTIEVASIERVEVQQYSVVVTLSEYDGPRRISLSPWSYFRLINWVEKIQSIE